MTVKTARELELEACIKQMLEGVASESLFENFCSDGKEIVVKAAKLVDFPMDQIGEPVEVYLKIYTEGFTSKYFDADDFDTDDFEVISVVVKHDGKLHTLTADDLEVEEE